MIRTVNEALIIIINLLACLSPPLSYSKTLLLILRRHLFGKKYLLIFWTKSFYVRFALVETVHPKWVLSFRISIVFCQVNCSAQNVTNFGKVRDTFYVQSMTKLNNIYYFSCIKAQRKFNKLFTEMN
jgi:hypothetical protein